VLSKDFLKGKQVPLYLLSRSMGTHITAMSTVNGVFNKVGKVKRAIYMVPAIDASYYRYKSLTPKLRTQFKQGKKVKVPNSSRTLADNKSYKDYMKKENLFRVNYKHDITYPVLLVYGEKDQTILKSFVDQIYKVFDNKKLVKEIGFPGSHMLSDKESMQQLKEIVNKDCDKFLKKKSKKKNLAKRNLAKRNPLRRNHLRKDLQRKNPLRKDLLRKNLQRKNLQKKIK